MFSGWRVPISLAGPMLHSFMGLRKPGVMEHRAFYITPGLFSSQTQASRVAPSELVIQDACARRLQYHGVPSVFSIRHNAKHLVGDLGDTSSLAYPCRGRQQMTVLLIQTRPSSDVGMR